MAGYNAPGVRFKVKCPYCGEIKESGGIKTHVLYKHRDYYKKEKYNALLDGNYYKQELVVFPLKEAKAIKKPAGAAETPTPIISQASTVKAAAGNQAGSETSGEPIQPRVARQEGSQPSPGVKPKHLEIAEVKTQMPLKQEAQQIPKEDEFGCQRCGATWKGFKPRCPQCNAELEYNQGE